MPSLDSDFHTELRFYEQRLTRIINSTINEPGALVGHIYSVGHPEYEAKLRWAFDFLRANGEGRYTDNTLMSLLRAADRQASEMRVAQEPLVIILGSPFTYDEETEVKSGGDAALAVVVPTDDLGTKTLVATVYGARRKGLGRVLVRFVRQLVDEQSSYWVGARATESILFGLACGLSPASMNGRQGLEMRWSRDGGGERFSPAVREEDRSEAWLAAEYVTDIVDPMPADDYHLTDRVVAPRPTVYRPRLDNTWEAVPS